MRCCCVPHWATFHTVFLFLFSFHFFEEIFFFLYCLLHGLLTFGFDGTSLDCLLCGSVW